MRNVSRARRAVSLTLALLFLPALPLPGAAAAPAPLASSPVDLSLWIHSDYSLSMAGNANELTGKTITQSWSMIDGLQKDLCIDGVDIGSGRIGFQVHLPVGFSTLLNAVNITVRVKDDNDAIAEDTFAFARNMAFSNSVWNLNFTSLRTNCIVQKFSKIALEFSSTSTLAVGNFNGAHIALRATDPVLPTVIVGNPSGPTDAFYPNDLPSFRAVIVNGTTGNAFTDSLIARVQVQFKDPGGTAVQTANAALTTGNYTYTWDYAPQTAGTYAVLIQVDDNQGHSYNTSTTIRFLNYGLRITTAQQTGDSATRYTTRDNPVGYDLSVLNRGGQPTVVDLVIENPPASGWVGSFAPPTLALDPGASSTTVFTMDPPSNLGAGNSTQATVIAQARDDPSALKARATLATTTIIINEITFTVVPTSTDSSVKVGGTAFYNFTISNNGGTATPVLFNATLAPEGWARDLSGPGLAVSGAEWRIDSLDPSAPRTLTLRVDAPQTTSAEPVFTCAVTGRSETNASAVATFTATARLILGIELAKNLPTTDAVVKPGELVDFEFAINNSDPLNGHQVAENDISVGENGSNKAPVAGNLGGYIHVGPFGDCCVPLQTGTVTVTVAMPQQVEAARYWFTLRVAVDHDDNKMVQLEFSVLVKTDYAYSIRINGTPTSIVLHEGTATVQATLYNDGNSRHPIYIDLAVLNAGKLDPTWTVRILASDGNELANPLSVLPYSSVPVELEITASPTALNGEKRELRVTLTRSLLGTDPKELSPPTSLVVELSPGSVFARLWTQSFYFVLLSVGVALLAGYLGLRALKGPRPPRPAVASAPAPSPSGGAEKGKPQAPLK